MTNRAARSSTSTILSQIIGYAASLKTTVVLLSLSMVLVFVMTLAQVKLGLFQAQKYYLSQWFVWTSLGELRLPIFPGGKLVGWGLMINLIVAHFKRFKWVKSKWGIWLTHSGLILLLLGGGITGYFAIESQLILKEGSTKNYSENFQEMELVVIDVNDPKTDTVVSFSQNALKNGRQLTHPSWPFSLTVDRFYPNSAFQKDPNDDAVLMVRPLPVETAMDRLNIVTADLTLEFLEKTEKSSPLKFTVSNGFKHPETFFIQGPEGVREYKIAIRPTRYYTPFLITLNEFTHEMYPGTTKPSFFSSDVTVKFEDGTAQDYLVYMNHPLRLDGRTYYQASYAEEGTVSILQVVQNPAWLMPYISCVMISIGLMLHFGMVLWRYLTRKRASA